MAFFIAFWDFLVLSAPYLLFGLIISGVINQVLSVGLVQRWLGRDSVSSIVKSSLAGVPLPLCSCSVIPTAVTLRKNGVGNGATSSFLISTPESGVDSIMLTYGLMGLPMAILRPIAAFISGFIAGVLNFAFNDFELKDLEEEKKCCHGGSKPKQSRIKEIFSFGFGKLLDDIAGWLLIGIVIGAALNVFLPDDIFSNLGMLSNRLIILLIGIPMYICASASTPIALSLMLKGLSPGCAILFLLIGPATNISNIAVLQKYIGIKGIVLNLIAISVVGLAFSFLIDMTMPDLFTSALKPIKEGHDHAHFSWWENLMAVLMLGLLLKGIYQENLKPLLKSR